MALGPWPFILVWSWRLADDIRGLFQSDVAPALFNKSDRRFWVKYTDVLVGPWSLTFIFLKAVIRKNNLVMVPMVARCSPSDSTQHNGESGKKYHAFTAVVVVFSPEKLLNSQRRVNCFNEPLRLSNQT